MREATDSIYRISEDQKPSTAAILALAEELNTPPEQLSEPLHAVVDPEALDSLVANRAGPATVQFQYGDRVVTVESSGTVEITEATGHA